MSNLIKQLVAELETLAAAHDLKVDYSFSAYELSNSNPQRRQRTFKYETVRKYNLDTVQGHCLVMNFEDKNGEYNGMILAGSLRRAIKMLQAGVDVFDVCEFGCDTCEVVQ